MSLKIHVNRPTKENTRNLKCRKFTDNLSAKTVRFMIVGVIRLCILVDFFAPFLADRPLLAYLQCIFHSPSTSACGRARISVQVKEISFYREKVFSGLFKIVEDNSTFDLFLC